MTTSPEGIPMTSTHPVPPLPLPQPPATAAHALANAAQAAARAWAQPLDSAQHQRAVSQLDSVLRDLGIAARGLAAWRVSGTPSGLVPREFARHVTAGARRIFDAWNCLDGVQAFEGFDPLPDPDEPGAALCHAARNVIPAWRQPTGTSADRDATIRRFITATGFLSAATLGLATYGPRRRAIDLQAALAMLAETIADLSEAIPETADDMAPEHGAGPAPDHPGVRE